MAERRKTKYPGVTEVDIIDAAGKRDKAFYVSYRVRQADGNWKQFQNIAGRVRRDGMTAKKASEIRVKRMKGEALPLAQKRAEAKAASRRKVWTISALADEYIQSNPHLRSAKDFHSIYRRYIGPAFGDKEPKDIQSLDVERLKRKQLAGKKPQTVWHVLELLRRLINFGVDRNLCEGLEFKLKLPVFHNETTSDLTVAQQAKLLSVLNQHIENHTEQRWGAYALKIALLTGMRLSEILRLRWADVNFDTRKIHLYDTKSSRPESIPLSSYSEVLLRQIQRVEAEDSPYVIPGRSGRQRTGIMRPVNVIRAEADLPKDYRPFHDSRHVFGTNLGNNGIDQDMIGRLMTHAQNRRTATARYVVYRESTLRAAAELAGQLLEQALEQYPSDDAGPHDQEGVSAFPATPLN